MIELFKLAGIVTIEGIDVAKKQLTGFEKSARNAIKPLVKFGKQAEATGKILTKNITLPILAVGAAAGKFAADFEKSMTTSLAIMGKEGEKFRVQLEETAKQISTESTFSADKLAESYYYLASAGFTAEQSIAALGKVAKFAEAGQFDLKIATDLLTDAQSALGLVSKDVTVNEQNMIRVSNALVKANTLANASVQQFSESLTNKAGASLRILGKDIEEGLAVLASFADQGDKGAEAGTHFSIVLRDLQKANQNSTKEFEKAGIAVYDTTGDMRNLADIIGDVENALEGKSDAEKKAQLSILGFQEKSVQSLLTLIGTSEKIRQYESNLRNAAGTTEEVAKKQLQNFNDQLKIMLNRLRVVAIELGTNLLPILKNDLLPIIEKMIFAIGSIVKGFNSWNPIVKKIAIGLIAFIAAAGPALVIIGKLAVASKVLIAILTGVKLAIIALGTAIGIGAGPITAIVAGIGALAAILIKLTTRQRKAAKLQKMMNDEMEAGTDKSKALRKAWENEADKLAKLNKEHETNLLFREKLSKLMDDPNFRGLPEAERRKRAKELKESLKEVNYESQNSQMYLEQSKQKYDQETKAIKENTEAKKANKGYTDEEIKIMADIEKANFKARERIGRQKIAEQERGKKNLLAIQAVEKKQEENKTADIIKNYRELQEEKKRLADIDNENAKKRLEDEEKIVQKRVDNLTMISQFGQQIGGIISGIYDNEAIAIDNNYKRQKKSIENSTKSEEEKKKALDDLDEKFDKKRSALRKKQAIAEKAQGIFSIGINTAVAVVKALPNLILSGIIGVLGAAQAAIVAAQPIPEMAEGGVIPKRSGGTLVNAGEAGDDEGFIPMKKGTASIANAIINNMRRYPTTGIEGMAGGAGKINSNNIHLNVGTLIADDKGLNELERRLKVFRISENNRLGIV